MKRIILILMLSLLLAACAPAQIALSPSQVPANTSAPNASITDLSRTDSQGAVTVKITPQNLDNPDDTLKFDVVMDTHSVELSMDLSTSAILATDTGENGRDQHRPLRHLIEIK